MHLIGAKKFVDALGIDTCNAICIECTMANSETLKQVRDRLKESQAAFAVRFGVDQATIHRWETDGVPDRGPAKKMVEIVLSSLPEPLAYAPEVFE